MKIKFTLTAENGEPIRAMFARLGNPEPALRDFGEYKRRQIVRSFPRLSRGTRSTPGLPPAKRSGLLSQRINCEVAGGRLDVGTYDVRAAMLHFGGIQRPRNAKFLTVPIHRDAIGKRARDFSNLTLIPRAGKPSLLVRKVMRGASGVEKKFDVMFVLLKSVKIPARPFLLWRPEDESYLVIALNKQWKGEQKGGHG